MKKSVIALVVVFAASAAASVFSTSVKMFNTAMWFSLIAFACVIAMGIIFQINELNSKKSHS